MTETNSPKLQQPSHINKGTIARFIVVIGLIFFMVLILIPDTRQGEDLTDCITATVTKADGTVTHADSSIFGLVGKGDRVDVEVYLPEDRKIEDSSMWFYIYHSEITATYEGEILYQSGQDIYARGDMIGVDYVGINIPDEAWGHTISIELLPHEADAFSRIKEIWVYQADHSFEFFIGGNEFMILIALTVFTAAIIVLLVVFIIQGFTAASKRAVYICTFAILACIWMVCGVGTYRVVSNAYFWRPLEFLSLFCMAIPMLLYGLTLDISKKYKTILRVTVILSGIFVITSAVLNAMNIVHLCEVLVLSHIILMASAIELFTVLVLYSKRTKAESAQTLLLGIIGLIIFSVLDLLRFNLTKYIPLFFSNKTPSLLPFGICTFVICLALAYITDLNSEKEQRTQLTYQMNLQLEHYKSIEERNSEMSTYRHDMKNHLLVVDTLIKDNQTEKASAYLEELNSSLSKKPGLIDTGNSILDAIISQKGEQARQKDIVFDTEIHIQPNLAIDPMDLCRIFGNLYDNALEACDRVPSKEKRIKTSLSMRGRSLVAVIENTAVEAPVEKGNGSFETSKKDREHHGYGLLSVKESVKRYQGIVGFHFNLGVFTATVMLQDVGKEENL